MKTTFMLLFALLCSLAGNGWQLYSAGGAKPKCEVRLAAQANQQAAATETDQHGADQQRIQQLSAEIVELQQDAAADADTRAVLAGRFQRQEETLKHVYDTDTLARMCLAARVPDALIHSLHAGAGGEAQPSGGGDALRR
jgi:hypothetical protein